MRGIKGLSEPLNALVESLPIDRLRAVAECAFRLASEDFAEDSVNNCAIRRFCAGSQLPDETLSHELGHMSNEADERYFHLEDSGADKSIYMREFCRARVLYALSLAFAARAIDSIVLDDVVYELGHGATNIDQFVANLEQSLRMNMSPE